MHPFSSCNHSLPATNAQPGSFLPTLAKQLPTIAQTLAKQLPTLAKQLPTIAQKLPTIAQTVAHYCPTVAHYCPKLAHVCPPWDAMLTGSPSRILETLCEALTGFSQSG